MTSLSTISSARSPAFGPYLGGVGGWGVRRPPALAPEAMEPAVRPLFCIQGVASEITSARLREKMRSPRLEHVQVGEYDCYLMHESEPGWPPAYRLTPGRAYSVEVFTCKQPSPKDARLPEDARTPDGLVFFAAARTLQPRRYEGDLRRVQRGRVGAWTDGLMLVCDPAAGSGRLRPGRVYKVVVRQLPH